MVKHASVLAVLALCVAAATASFYYDAKTADKDFLIKQKKVYNLVYHVAQANIVNPEFYNLGKSWNFEEKFDFYTNKEAVHDFLKIYKHGPVPKGAIFSIYYQKHIDECLALFRVFYYAKDFDTFFNTALWARVHVNEGTFLYALYQAVFRRPDTQYIQMPPPYEIYPCAFFNSEVLEKAKNAHLYREISHNPDHEGYNTVIINANYSGWYIHHEFDREAKLNYFTEDIGFNAYYFYFRQDSPFWLNSEEFGLEKNIRGEAYLYGHHQIMARYYLERFANGLGYVEDFDWNHKFYPGYYPSMSYHNGLPFPQRPYSSHIPHHKYKYSQDIQEFETRIKAAIDIGYVFNDEGKQVKIYSPEGLNILGNLIEGNADSCNKDFYGSYDSYARKIFGFNYEPKSDYQIIPSALESFSTSLRDPAFYRIYQKIYWFYYKYKAHMKPYTKEELVHPNIHVDTVAVDKLVTYFDDFDTTISNGLLVSSQKEADNFLVKVRQERLNHKPFIVHLGINVDTATKVSIQFFLGPKYNSQHESFFFNQASPFFYEIDYWITDLHAGQNKIERSSHDFFFTSPDQLPSEVYYNSVGRALDVSEKFEYQQRIFGFPQRLLLPKGSTGGTTFQLFVYVTPIVDEPIEFKSRIFGDYFFNKKPFGFPLDRPVKYSDNFDGPNIFFKDVVIYHKDNLDINATV